MPIISTLGIHRKDGRRQPWYISDIWCIMRYIKTHPFCFYTDSSSRLLEFYSLLLSAAKKCSLSCRSPLDRLNSDIASLAESPNLSRMFSINISRILIENIVSMITKIAPQTCDILDAISENIEKGW